MATHFSILPWRIPWTEEPGGPQTIILGRSLQGSRLDFAQCHQALLSMEFSRQEHWSGLPCPPPGDLPNPGIKPRSPALQADSLPSEPPGKPSLYM